MNRTLSTIFAITLMAFGAHGADAQTIISTVIKAWPS